MVAIQRRMRDIKHKILVLSGKGGVGKSTFAAQLAFALAAKDKDVRHPIHTCTCCVWLVLAPFVAKPSTRSVIIGCGAMCCP